MAGMYGFTREAVRVKVKVKKKKNKRQWFLFHYCESMDMVL